MESLNLGTFHVNRDDYKVRRNSLKGSMEVRLKVNKKGGLTKHVRLN